MAGQKGGNIDNIIYDRFLTFSKDPDPEEIENVANSGFDGIVLNFETTFSSDANPIIAKKPLRTILRLRLDRFDLADELIERCPEVFAVGAGHAGSGTVHDPREPAPASGEARVLLDRLEPGNPVAERVALRLEALLDAGADGFVFEGLEARAVPFHRALAERLRDRRQGVLLIAATPGLPRDDALALARSGAFDRCLSSFGWWDQRARWLLDENAALAPHCPLVAEITPAAASRASDPEAARTLLVAALFTGSGALVPADLAARIGDAEDLARAMAQDAPLGGMEVLTAAGSPVTGIIRHDAADERSAQAARILLLNPGQAPADIPASLLDGRRWRQLRRIDGTADPLAPLGPHEARLLAAEAPRAVAHKARGSKKAAMIAAEAPRIIVENLVPRVDGGDFAVKCIVGTRIEVGAHIYTDGHEKIGARLLWRAERAREWNAVPMFEEGNDEWSAAFTPERLGRHEFTVEAWDDRFGYFRESIVKKVEAGVAQPVDFEEGRRFLENARRSADSKHRAVLDQALAALDGAESDAARRDVFTDPAVVEAMEALDPHHHRAAAPPQLLDAERREAQFSSWYELFPRSMTDDKSRHGTLRDVIGHLPRVAEMGFDTLYFPPIHPIGKTNRKGPDNTLTPEARDPGSPYAIGSPEGGHDAIHPELGDFEDFRALVAAAKEHGLEIALDFAIQCSPDHPWLAEHPGWFAWRPDGSMKYAENPPKKYQDIVNVDFYGPDAVPGLWLALRDVVLLWVSEGVKVFRVDNPHTKPFPFWEWMIREVRSAHPEVIFLSEAFTRPKVMYRLAKVGFSQSYTYFTWRNSKAELTEYVEELTKEAPRNFFRPHFFVNTPDINPVFLQTGGRPAHRIRAVLAATLSGLWGVYSGFELCDAAPLPGREEYAASEKYEIRPREWRASGDIVADVTLLNRLRRGHPALQTHLNTRFYPAHDDSVIFYGKPSADGSDMILVMVNMDPHGEHSCDFEVPLWEFGLPDDGALAVEDLASGERFAWHGKHHSIHLTPDEPYRIWRIEPEGGAHG
ncbi:alpha-1,4-glucan:maltose-1-phosphate maltosyltransferase [Erythrobacter sp. HL-111]|nr:MAG: starch synthase (maltosyl-transferring) [Erythrobacteraceae bacterium HL-111]SDR96061.1 alpha-1,4-glucan:maltose-1-phosphate maltosyltransferase [Erythrobacter sp. HL-111]